MDLTFILPIILLVILIGLFVSIYNGLIARRNEFANALAQIDVQLTRRYDLIPNLIEVAKKYLEHEKETLVAVISARNQASTALKNGQMDVLTQAEASLGKQLGGLYATFENYPELKADKQLQALQEEIVSSENRVAFARQYFNDAVTDYNDYLQKFPNNIVAGFCRFAPQELLEIDDIAEKRQPVKVSFD